MPGLRMGVQEVKKAGGYKIGREKIVVVLCRFNGGWCVGNDVVGAYDGS